MKFRLYIGLFLWLVSASVMSAVTLKADHPNQHTVVRGDTLWDISGLFLNNPWQWPEIWEVNPQIKNPHLIYPGDVIILQYRAGQPFLSMSRGQRTVKLSPKVRPVMIDTPISTIPFDAIKPFLRRPQVLGDDALNQAGYVVAAIEERLISGAGDRVYARGLNTYAASDEYSVFRQGKTYYDPDTNELLGYEALYGADATLLKSGDPATLELGSVTREVRTGDRLLPSVADEASGNFTLSFPKRRIEGKILAVLGGVSQIGQYQVAVLNRGAREGLVPGHVIAIHQAGDTVRDYVSEKRGEQVTLPDEYAGTAMVFKSFEKVSYVLVMKAVRAIHIGDKVTTL